MDGFVSRDYVAIIRITTFICFLHPESKIIFKGKFDACTFVNIEPKSKTFHKFLWLYFDFTVTKEILSIYTHSYTWAAIILEKEAPQILKTCKKKVCYGFTIILELIRREICTFRKFKGQKGRLT